jgi:hypothetical protein
MGTGALFPELKRPGSEENSPPATAKVKKIWINQRVKTTVNMSVPRTHLPTVYLNIFEEKSNAIQATSNWQ